MLWERKYQLEKEMQEDLNPDVGQSEIEELKKELHRMELRHNSLLKEQKKILVDAERAIDKKDQIEMKYVASVKKEGAKGKQPANSNQLKNNMRNIQDNMGKILRSLNDTEKQLSRRENDLEGMAQQIEDSLTDLKQLEHENLNLDTERVLGRTRKNIDLL